MSPEKDALDVDLSILVDKQVIDVSLPDAVAHGKLFLLNNNGEYVPVEIASYWKRDAILSVCRQGYEWNEDGETTRDWRKESDQG